MGASQFLAGLNAPSKNPKGIPPQSPGSRVPRCSEAKAGGTSYSGLIVGRMNVPMQG
jgi:hypothetical protein